MTVLVGSFIAIVALVGLGYATRHIEAKGYDRGYAAGRQDERRSDLHKLNRVFHQAVAQGLIARRELDCLYEQARRRIDDLSRW